MCAAVETSLAVSRAWHHLSARDAILGKLSVRVALLLMGKDKPIYDPSQDIGDYVVVTDARHVKVTGKKRQQKVYRHHTMFPGGLKEIKYEDMMEKKPTEVSSGAGGPKSDHTCSCQSALHLCLTCRSSARPYRGCCQRTRSAIVASRDYSSLPMKSTHTRTSECERMARAC